MDESVKLYLFGLMIVGIVILILALPYSLMETYGIKTKKLMIIVDTAVIAVFSAIVFFSWWIKDRKTNRKCSNFNRGLKRLWKIFYF